MTFKFGDKVKANLGNGPRVAFVLEGPYDVQGADGPEQKYKLQGPDGKEHEMAYTGPENDLGGGFFTDI